MDKLIRPVRQSELAVFNDCLLKWYFSFYKGFLSSRINKHFWLGTLVHFCLSEFHLGRTTDPAHLFYSMADELIDYERGPQVTIGDEELDYNEVYELEQYRQLGIAMLEGYQEWISDPMNGDFEVIDTELAIYLQIEDLEGRTFTYVGRYDAVVENSEGIWIPDFKTAATFRDEDTVHTYQQFRRYPWALGRIHPEWKDEIAGAMWIALRKIEPSNRSKPPYFKRQLIDIRPDEHQGIENEVLAEATAMLTLEEKLDNGVNPRSVIYPSPKESCKWMCDYFQNGMCMLWRTGKEYYEIGEAHGTWDNDPYLEYRAEWSDAVPVVIGRRVE